MKQRIIFFISLLAICLMACEKDESEPVPSNTNPTPVMPAGFESWANIFEGEGVGAIHGQGEATLIFSKSGTQYAWFEGNQIIGIRNVKAANSHFKDLPLQTVGAMGRVKELGINNGSIMVYNEAGTRYTIIKPDNYNAKGMFGDLDFFTFSTNSYTPYDMWNDGTYPFATVDAILADYSTSGPTGLAIYFAKKGGAQYCYLVNDSSPIFSQGFGTSELMMRAWNNGETPVAMNMTNIGAMSTIKVNSQTTYKIFFTADGKQFRIWNEYDAVVSQLYSLY